jgi:uncharacterized protein with PIN domain
MVDSSAIVAVALGESSALKVRAQLADALKIRASALLEAEVRSACRREGREVAPAVLARIELVHPSRPLTDEINRVLDAGLLTGADCWHLAIALYVAPDPQEMTFLTLDERQHEVAKKLGFRV